MKIIDRIQKRQEEGRPFFSFEYFSPKTPQGMINLNDRIERMCYLGPEFVDITWGAGGSRPAATLEVVSNVQKVLGIETCMHLICTDNPVQNIDRALKEARACGNQNILALRGDPPAGQKHWIPHPDGFPSVLDLIRHIRHTHGDYFGIAVAAYPECHPESPSPTHDLLHLKRKVDVGADFIVTQLFFDVPLFLQWVKNVRKAGIHCPIVPGIMPIQTYAGFKKNVIDAGLSVPGWIRDGLEKVKEDEAAVKAFGVQVGIKMVQELIESKVVGGVHFYTFNLEKSTRLVLEGSGLVSSSCIQSSPQSKYQREDGDASAPSTSTTPIAPSLSSPNPSRQSITPLSVIRKEKPWRTNFSHHRRHREYQRPIFWANRPRSYISRTETWQHFPATCSQWNQPTSSSSSASLPREYGGLDRYGVSIKYTTATEARLYWGGEPERIEDLCRLFQKYWQGELHSLPWCDQPPNSSISCTDTGGLCYKDKLVELNSTGVYLAINAQPAVNGARSDDKVFGWGPSGGYVYQKAFLEFFISPIQLPILIHRLKTQFQNFSYNAINRSGSTFLRSSPCPSTKSKVDKDDNKEPNTVTWGVFPNQEIVEPIIIERSSFLAWKEEAFSLWDQWAKCFEDDTCSTTTGKMLREIGASWFLMNVVSDDYCAPQSVFELFEEDICSVRDRRKDMTEDQARDDGTDAAALLPSEIPNTVHSHFGERGDIETDVLMGKNDDDDCSNVLSRVDTVALAAVVTATTAAEAANVASMRNRVYQTTFSVDTIVPIAVEARFGA
ncbi:hypothetical protein FBU30_008205 [Linnemannia zychae]|nr:hypothetical protein FBU30_008205 [Linnemannia zychae]